MKIPKLGIKITRVKPVNDGEFIVDYGSGEIARVPGIYFAVYKGGERPKNGTILKLDQLLLNGDLANYFETGPSDIYDPSGPFLCSDMKTVLSVLANKYKSDPFIMLMMKIAAMNILTAAQAAGKGEGEPSLMTRIVTSSMSKEELEVMELYQIGINAAPSFINHLIDKVRNERSSSN